MLEIVRKRPKQFDLAPLRIEPRPHTAHFVIPVGEGGERKTVYDGPCATLERSLSDGRNLCLAHHVSSPKEPFNDLGLRINDCLCVVIRPRLGRAIDSCRSRLDASPQDIQHFRMGIVLNRVVEKTQKELDSWATLVYEHGAIHRLVRQRWEAQPLLASCEPRRQVWPRCCARKATRTTATGLRGRIGASSFHYGRRIRWAFCWGPRSGSTAHT